jgi:large subunit ribosomal protein L23
MSKSLTLIPRLNEKTYALAADRVYVFTVDKTANKHSIARAVESQFDVKVIKVNTLNTEGKAKRTISINGKRSVNSEGRRNDIRKAYVTLAEGNSLPFFDAIDEEQKQQEEAQAKFDEAAIKAAAKEAKKSKKKEDK